VAVAAKLGAVAINNSYGGPESDPDSVASYNFYNQPGTAVVASSGDDGYLKTPNDTGVVMQEIAFPAASPYVISVGGTSLAMSASTRGWAETTWNGAGSGCSKSQTKPTWQKDPACTKRMVADISATANPAPRAGGVATYNSSANGWSVIGGTSVAAPIISGILALFNVTDPAWPYAHPASFFDVVGGSNGACGGTYPCTALAGFDGPTGLGTPNGALFNAPAVDGGSGPGAGGNGGGGGGGAGGTGPAAGASGAAGTAGTAGAGGGGGAGGATGTGGAPSGAGGSATTGTGTAGSAGSTTSGPSTSTGSATTGAGGSGKGTVTNVTPEETKGCSCRIGQAPKTSTTNLAGLLVIGLGSLVTLRRRSRSSRARS
jgi:MYXO-CTERM domain-containing protein